MLHNNPKSQNNMIFGFHTQFMYNITTLGFPEQLTIRN